MKGLDAVLRGYAIGGPVNPFTGYASYYTNPFYALEQLAAQPRTPYRSSSAATPPPSNPTPRPTSGYMSIYGNLPAVIDRQQQQAQEATRRDEEAAAAEATATVPRDTDPSASDTGFNPSTPAPVGTGYNTAGNVANIIGGLTSIPGLGSLGSAYGATQANQTLQDLGLTPNISIGDAMLAGLTGGLFGSNPQAQFDRAISEALTTQAGGAVNPDDVGLAILDKLNELKAAREAQVAEISNPLTSYAGQVARDQMTPGAAATAASQSLDTVGILGQVLDAIDKAAGKSTPTAEVVPGQREYEAQAPFDFTVPDAPPDDTTVERETFPAPARSMELDYLAAAPIGSTAEDALEAPSTSPLAQESELAAALAEAASPTFAAPAETPATFENELAAALAEAASSPSVDTTTPTTGGPVLDTSFAGFDFGLGLPSTPSQDIDVSVDQDVDAGDADAGGDADSGGGDTDSGGGGGDTDAGGGGGDGGGGGGGGADFGEGGYVPGASGGMDDDVPAVIDGQKPARLSSGEFVFDAATVAALGDGNNEAGAKKLNQLREIIRMKAFGKKTQPGKNFSIGDLVRLYDTPRRNR